MKRLMKAGLALVAASLFSMPAMAQIDYFENFEGLNAADGAALTDAGWLVGANVFNDYPGCSGFIYNYFSFPAPNGGPAFSSVVTDSPSGQALNAYSDYNNGDHANGFCIEALVFQERVLGSGDLIEMEFSFNTYTPAPPDDMLGPDVSTFAFIKVLEAAPSFAQLYVQTVDTSSNGFRSLQVDLSGFSENDIVQWGYGSLASNYEPSGRWYDNVYFGEPIPPEPGTFVNIPTLDQWGLLIMALLLGGLGLFTITRR